nr:hypothetical protein [Streptomyces sp.]
MFPDHWSFLLGEICLYSFVVLVLTGVYPFLEARFTGGRGERHLLDRPRDRPVRTAIGAAWISLRLVLPAGGGNDVVAARFHRSINTVTWAVRIAVFAVPAVVLAVTRRVCPGPQQPDRELVAHGPAAERPPARRDGIRP